MPSDKITKLVQSSFLAFKQKIKHKLLILNNNWLGSKDDPCYNHKTFLIEHLVITNIFKFCKWYKCQKKPKAKI